MSKYNDYAKKLEQAYHAARAEYFTKWESLQMAKKDLERAQSLGFKETYIGEKEHKVAVARAKYAEADNAFRASRAVWDDFRKIAGRLTVELKNELGAETAVPEDIDSNALELMKSGVMSSKDYAVLVDKYKDNHTMLRLIQKYVKDASESAERGEKGKLTLVAQSAGERLNAKALEWDSLVNSMNILTYNDRRSDELAVNMMSRYEELMESRVENF